FIITAHGTYVDLPSPPTRRSSDLGRPRREGAGAVPRPRPPRPRLRPPQAAADHRRRRRPRPAAVRRRTPPPLAGSAAQREGPRRFRRGPLACSARRFVGGFLLRGP